MPPNAPPDASLHPALLFALATEALCAHYDHGHWPTEAQLASLAQQWLARQQLQLDLADRRRLAGMADLLARQLAASLSREAGLHTAHEMRESLDPRYNSPLARTVLYTCEQWLAGGDNPGN